MQIRPLEGSDHDRFAAFLAAIPEGDRTFFKEDVLDESAVAEWSSGSAKGRRMVAVDGDDVVGYLAVVPGVGWTAHVGEIRLVVAPSHRRGGVGKGLARAAIAVAVEQDVAKLMVEVVTDQTAAIGMFTDLGFEGEALLRDHVRDRDGTLHDLIVLAHHVDDEWAGMITSGIADAVGS